MSFVASGRLTSLVSMARAKMATQEPADVKAPNKKAASQEVTTAEKMADGVKKAHRRRRPGALRRFFLLELVPLSLCRQACREGDPRLPGIDKAAHSEGAVPASGA